MSKKLFYYGSTSSYTARTIAFIASTGIADLTIINALNTLDLALISAGIDTKMIALYPFVGGTATTHKYNFMDAQDTNAAFRLTFYGGLTHSSTGILGNGSTGYIDTNCAHNNLAQNSAHISFYSRTSGDIHRFDMAVMDGAGTSRLEIICKWTDNTMYYGVNCGELSAGTPTNGAGLFVANRTASNVLNAWRNSTKLATAATASVATTAFNIYILARNFGGVADYKSDREVAFATIGSGLTDTDVSNLYTAVQAFQTSLSRQV